MKTQISMSCLAIYFALVFGLYAHGQTRMTSIERVKVLGANISGSKAAFLITRLDPISKVPFGVIKIISHATPNVITLRSKKDIYGVGEMALEKLERYLILKFSDEIDQHGIDLFTQPMESFPSFPTISENQEFTGYVDLKDDWPMAEYTLKKVTTSANCSQGLDWEYCLNGSCIRSPKSEISCQTQNIAPAGIYRYGSYAWISVSRQYLAFSDTYASMIDIFPMKVKISKN